MLGKEKDEVLLSYLWSSLAWSWSFIKQRIQGHPGKPQSHSTPHPTVQSSLGPSSPLRDPWLESCSPHGLWKMISHPFLSSLGVLKLLPASVCVCVAKDGDCWVGLLCLKRNIDCTFSCESWNQEEFEWEVGSKRRRFPISLRICGEEIGWRW